MDDIPKFVKQQFSEHNDLYFEISHIPAASFSTKLGASSLCMVLFAFFLGAVLSLFLVRGGRVASISKGTTDVVYLAVFPQTELAM